MDSARWIFRVCFCLIISPNDTATLIVVCRKSHFSAGSATQLIEVAQNAVLREPSPILLHPKVVVVAYEDIADLYYLEIYVFGSTRGTGQFEMLRIDPFHINGCSPSGAKDNLAMCVVIRNTFTSHAHKSRTPAHCSTVSL